MSNDVNNTITEITKENYNEAVKLIESKKIYEVELDLIVDADINPRTIDIKYAEQIPVSAPPVILGYISGENDEFYNKLIIIDGNHRLYCWNEIYNLKSCYAIIKKYNTLYEATIDAFRLNIYHGKRLSDKEICAGIKRIINYSLKKGETITYGKLGKTLNMNKTAVVEYVKWEKIEKMVGADIDKRKAVVLSTLLTTSENPEEQKRLVKIYWGFTKELSIKKTLDLIRYYRQTKIICDYENYKINIALSQESDIDDGIENNLIKEPETVEVIKKEIEIQPKNIVIENKYDENNNVSKEYKEENEEVIETKTTENDEQEIEENDYTEDNKLKENGINKTVIDVLYQAKSIENIESVEITEKNYREPEIIKKKQEPEKIVEAKKEIEEDRAIEYILKKSKKEEVVVQEPKEETNLVAVKGLVRKYSFDTVLSNIFDELTEDLLNSSNILNETLEKNLHANRKEFENNKERYLAQLRNCSGILNKIINSITKANKDFKNVD